MEQSGRDVEDVKDGVADAVVDDEPGLAVLARSAVIREPARLVVLGQHGILFDVSVVHPLFDFFAIRRYLGQVSTKVSLAHLIFPRQSQRWTYFTN